MERNLEEEYLELIKITKEKKKENELLYPIYKQSNNLLKNIRNTNELRLDAYLSDEIIGEESRRIFLECTNNITVNTYIDLVISNNMNHRMISQRYFRGASFPPILSLSGSLLRQEKKQKKIKAEKTQEKPEEIEGVEEVDVPNEIKKIFLILKQKEEIELYRVVIDPNSFSRTIENILSVSFAVKVGRAFIEEREDILYLTLERKGEQKDCIISITEEEMDRIVESMKIEESML